MKNMNEKDILLALNEVDEKYLETARPKRKKKIPLGRIALAASLVIVIGAAIALGMSGMLSGGGNIAEIPNNNSAQPPNNNNSALPDEDGGEGFPTLPDRDDKAESPGLPGDEEIDDRPDSAEPPELNEEIIIENYLAGENYSRLFAIINGYSSDTRKSRDDLMMDFDLPGESLDQGADGDDAETNGTSIDITENQVSGVEEPDIVKMTDKYIFHIGNAGDGTGQSLRIYTVAGELSEKVCDYELPHFDGSKHLVGAKMFLSKDCKSLIILRSYRAEQDENGAYKTLLLKLDISDVTEPKQDKAIWVGGTCDFARISGDNIILGTSFLATKHKFEWTDPDVYLPYYEIDGEKSYLSPDQIICPDEITKKCYSSLFILDGELNILSSQAIFGVSGVYGTSFVSDDKVIYAMGYGDDFDSSTDRSVGCKSDVVVLDYSSGNIKVESLFTVDGWIEDRYFVDESDGYLRIVTNGYNYLNGYELSPSESSLAVYDISTGTKIASVNDFAPEGEKVTAVRFEGDKCFVCTAEIKSYVDPVFYFDLSDYSNITEVNTGFIDGFSTNLITFGDGYLLGIGELNSGTGKVSIYKREEDAVITLSEFTFKGRYAGDRKAYLIDRENRLFGFVSGGNSGVYHLLHFDGENLTEIYSHEISYECLKARSVYYGGYLYILRVLDFDFEKIN